MRLTKRLEALEAQSIPDNGPQIIFIEGVYPDRDHSKVCGVSASYGEHEITVPITCEAERESAMDKLETWANDINQAERVKLVFYSWIWPGFND